MQVNDVFLPILWQKFLGKELSETAHELLGQLYQPNTLCYPPKSHIFKAFELCPPNNVKAIILGQDPYHNQGQAMGLSFSVPLGAKIPPSLRRIFKELMLDTGQDFPFSGDLTKWAKEGVLLLNAMLSVEHNKPGSHSKSGWQDFTDGVIAKISSEMDHKVFLFWGAVAQKKEKFVDIEKHRVLKAAHPSPLAGNKFAGCAHFTKTNAYLKKHNQKTIEWKLN